MKAGSTNGESWKWRRRNSEQKRRQLEMRMATRGQATTKTGHVNDEYWQCERLAAGWMDADCLAGWLPIRFLAQLSNNKIRATANQQEDSCHR